MRLLDIQFSSSRYFLCISGGDNMVEIPVMGWKTTLNGVTLLVKLISD